MRIVVVDAQGAGIGQAIIKKIRRELGPKPFIIGLGTNEYAALNMKKCGADNIIWGETDICNFCNSNNVDFLIGPIGIIISGGINGEITSSISTALMKMDCKKYIIPLQKHGIYIPGTKNMEIKEFILEIITDIKNQTLSL